MARDWPADRYDYKLRKEMRTFGAVLVHIASGNVYAAKVGRGEKAKWDELDPAKYPDKAAVVALLEKSFADSEAVLKGLPDASFAKTVDPWLERDGTFRRALWPAGRLLSRQRDDASRVAAEEVSADSRRRSFSQVVAGTTVAVQASNLSFPRRQPRKSLFDFSPPPLILRAAYRGHSQPNVPAVSNP